MKYLASLIFSALILVSGLMLAAPTYALTTSQKDICAGSTGSATGGCTASGPTLSDTVAVVVNILSAVVGVVSVIMIMLAGFRYVTSAGDSSKLAGAKTTLIYAIVGLIIVAFAQFIVQFVIHKVS